MDERFVAIDSPAVRFQTGRVQSNQGATMTNSADTSAILVLGSTGKIGRRVVERLTARGVPARAGVRSGEPPFDWDERVTW
jgi:hypothetical protein